MSVFVPVVRARARGRSKRASILRRAIESLEARRLFTVTVVETGTHWNTIQDAIDNAPAGANINCDPGTYTEQVVVFNGVKVHGAKAGIDARSNTRASGAGESIVTGIVGGDGRTSFAFKVVGSDCTIDGFTIQGQSSVSTVTGAAVVINPNIAGTHIINNIIQNNVTGIYLSSSSATDPCVIQHNVIRNNNVSGGAETGFGIYTDGGVSGGVLTNVQIDANFFFNNLGELNFQVQPAIALVAGPASQQTNISVTNNVFDKNGKAVLAFNASGLTIDNNVIVNHWDVSSAALRFEGNVSGVTITHNNLYADGARAIYLDLKASSVPNSNFTINNNNIYQNGLEPEGSREGLRIAANAYTGTLDATNNWWGAADGPGGDFTGSGDKVTGNGAVTVQPFATAPVYTLEFPYNGLAGTTGAPIEAENFDEGFQDVAYHDTTQGNNPGSYRPNIDVDIDVSSDTPNTGYMVTGTKAGEWLNYALNVPTTGTYEFDARVLSAAAGAAFHIEIDSNASFSGSISIPSNASWQTVVTNGLFLTAGLHNMKLVFDTNNASGNVGNWNWFQFLFSTVQPPPAAPTGLAASAASASRVNLTWMDNSNNETGFVIERSPDGMTGWTQVATALPNATSASDTSAGLVVGNTYFYRVRATGVSSDSANSNTASVTLALPTAPTGLVAAVASSSQINLTWTDTSNNESNFIVERSTSGTTGWTQVGTPAANSTSFSDSTGLSAKTKYYYRVRATNLIGDSPNSAVAFATTLASNGLPSPWIDADIGTTGVAGSITYAPTTGTFTQKGGGLDIWNNADAFNFSYVPVTGDVTIIAKFNSLSGVSGAFAGIMIRNTLDAGSTEASVFDDTGNHIGFVHRLTTNGTTTAETSTGTYPRWLKLIRTASTNGFTAWQSSDGNTYTPVGGTVTIPMAANVFVGLATCGTSTTTLATATFTNVSITSAPNAPTGLTASAASSSQINLTWTDNAINETSFKLERSLNGTTGWVQVATPDFDLTSFSDTGLSASTTYFYRLRASNATGDSTYSAVASATTSAAAQPPATPTGGTPNGVFVNAVPLTLDWDDSANAVSYDVLLGASDTFFTNITQSQLTNFTPAGGDGVQVWRIVARNSTGQTAQGPQWSFTVDTTPPTATYGAQVPTDQSTTFDFTVTYADATSGVNTASFDNSDVTVTGPNNFSANATFISANGNVATYRIAAPGGTWEITDNGTYTVSQNAVNGVKDNANNFRPSGSIGTFSFTGTNGGGGGGQFAWMSGSTLNIQFDGTGTPIALGTSGQSVTAKLGDGTPVSFAGVTAIAVTGSAVGDPLSLTGAIPAAISYTASNGNDSVEVSSGSATFASDLSSAALHNVNLSIAGGASATFLASQHLNFFFDFGTATLTAGGNKVIVAQNFTISGGQLDLKDNDLVVDYTGASPVGSWNSNGNAYDGITGLVASGRNGGAWNGFGIITTMATGSRTTLGVAQSSQVLGASGGVFDGQSIDGSAVIVKFTYVGDATLDGKIDVLDYGQIDSNIPLGTTGWFNGDFNFDGKIDILDYGLIDANIAAQGPQL